jgi:NADPH:quinone reductase-like Zn-dependent oxidoreductase
VARLFGGRVIATAGSPEKLAKARDLGAEEVIDYREEDFARRVREITSKRGVDVVIDSVGVDTWQGSLKCLAKGGRFVFCGATSGWDVQTDLRRVFFKGISILGSTMGSQGEMREAVRHLSAGRLKPVLAEVLPLEEAGEAHRRLEGREVFGKIVLEP